MNLNMRRPPRQQSRTRATTQQPAARPAAPKKAQNASNRRPAQAHSPSERVRLHKAIAAAGISSRRRAEALIRSGRVSVNGHVVREMGVQVEPERDEI